MGINCFQGRRLFGCDDVYIADENPHWYSLAKCFTVLQSNTVWQSNTIWQRCGEHPGALNESLKNKCFTDQPNNLLPWKFHLDQ